MYKTVQELIADLSKYPPDAMPLVYDDEHDQYVGLERVEGARGEYHRGTMEYERGDNYGKDHSITREEATQVLMHYWS